MLSLLDIGGASVLIAANMGNLFINLTFEISSSEQEVIFIIIFLLKLAVVLMSLGNLEQYFWLLLLILIVWIDQHVLVFVGYIVVLGNLLVLVWFNIQNNTLLLNQEMWVLMLQEWIEYSNIILSLILTDPSITSPSTFRWALTKAEVIVAESSSFILFIDSFNIKFGVSPCRDSFLFQLVVSSTVIQILVNEQVA